MTDARWNPVGLSLTRGTKLKAAASDIEDTGYPDCDLRLALKMRADTRVDAGKWSRNWQDQFPLGWFVDALPVLHRQLEAGGSAETALAAARATWVAAHPGLRLYLDHAVDEYLDFHLSREQAVGPLHYRGHNSELILNRKAGTSLSAWAPRYDGTNGYREVRRLRMREPHAEVTAWAAIAAKIAGNLGAPGSNVSVIEVSLANGSDVVLVDASPLAAVEQLYERLAQPRARSIAYGILAKPCSKCGDCKAVAVCSQPIPMQGVLRQPTRGTHTRSVSATDLALYERCPSRWYMDRECRLPLEEFDASGADARGRGSAVHRWLKEAHGRGYACTAEDLPEPADWDTGHIGFTSLDAEQYQSALPFLRQHIENCAAEDGDLIAVDESFYGWDADADVIVAATPDLVRQIDNTLVVREVKTTGNALPESGLVARDQFDGVVYWWLSLLAGGWLDHYNCQDGVVELEILRPDNSVVYRYRTSDEDLMDMAESRMDSRVESWHVDKTWMAKPGPDCPGCPVRRWCPERDVYLDAVTTAQEEAPF